MRKIKDKVYWIWLANIPGVGARKFYYIMEYFGRPEMVWTAGRGDIENLSSLLGKNVVNNILTHKRQNYLESAERILETPGIRIVTLEDHEYPNILKTTYDPPPILYCKGKTLCLDTPVISVVGSRRSTWYGKQMAEKFAFRLAASGVVIVSGLARGIDTMAHMGALKAGGYTIGVLGCGIDVIYPPENRKLFNQLEEKGTIISEYPPGTQPLPGNFPARNRIISGLSCGVLVIEAGIRSGALITVDYALEQGRDVYALPGNINNPYSMGTNNIIKEGAKPVTCVEDILEDINNNMGLPTSSCSSRAVVQLDFFETAVYNALEDGEKHLEQLAKITKFDMGKLNAVLTILEIKGIVKQMPGKIFIRN